MSRKSWIITALVVVLGVLIVLIFLDQGAPISYKKLFSNDEAKDLLDLNQTAIAQGNSASSAAVPAINNQDHLLGEKNGEIKMVVYENPNDLYSAELASNLNILLSENQKDIALAVRYYFPKTDMVAWQNAVALECAAKDGKYSEARTWLMGKLTKKEVVSWSGAQKDLGLNSSFAVCLNDEGIKKGIEAGLDQTKTAPIYGAPTLFVGSEIITGSRSLDEITNSAGEKLEGLRNIIKRQLGA